MEEMGFVVGCGFFFFIIANKNGLKSARKNKGNLKGLYNGRSSLRGEIATSITKNEIPF